MTDGLSREGGPRSRQVGCRVTGVSPERATYETAAALFATGAIGVPVLPREELDRDERDGWAKIRQAALGSGDRS